MGLACIEAFSTFCIDERDGRDGKSSRFNGRGETVMGHSFGSLWAECAGDNLYMGPGGVMLDVRGRVERISFAWNR